MHLVCTLLNYDDIKCTDYYDVVILVVCSNPSLKFVKEFLRFSLSRQGPWEENNTKNHKEWPKKSPMATDSD